MNNEQAILSESNPFFNYFIIQPKYYTNHTNNHNIIMFKVSTHKIHSVHSRQIKLIWFLAPCVLLLPKYYQALRIDFPLITHRTKQSLSNKVSTVRKAIKSTVEEKWTEKVAKRPKYILKRKKIHKLAVNFILNNLIL